MKNLLKVASIAVMMTFAFVGQRSEAQIFSDFEYPAVVAADWTALPGGAGSTLLRSTDFRKQPLSNTTDPLLIDRNDGYVKIPIGFNFEYNGEVYNQVYICVNGFIQFTNDPADIKNLPMSNNNAMFENNSSWPNNIVAPFYGDHYYRGGVPGNETVADFATTPGLGYMPSEIRYLVQTISGQKVLTIEWKNLNINNPALNSSVANFQVKLYESGDIYNAQGDIEFCYGPIGGNPNTNNVLVETKNAVVGIKGEDGHYYNCLGSLTTYKTALTKTNAWQPTGATNKRYRINAKNTLKIEEFWGDGDADFSKAQGQRHYGLPQNRFTNFNDVRVILKSVVSGTPLDSVRRRTAYHADVNHNGRYFYSINTLVVPAETTRVDIPVKSRQYYEDLIPYGVQSVKNVYYQANSYDASVIIAYMSARITELPWIYDSIPEYGKVENNVIANNINIGSIESVENEIVKVPVYLNGNYNGPVATTFEVDGEIVNVTTTEIGNKSFAEFSNNKVAFAGAGEFTNEQPIMIVEVRKANNNITLSNINFNDANTGKISTNVSKDTKADIKVTQSNENYNFSVQIPNEGIYNVAIYDVLGNVVKNLYNNNAQVGTLELSWDNVSNTGVYFIKVSGNNVNLSNKFVVNK